VQRQQEVQEDRLSRRQRTDSPDILVKHLHQNRWVQLAHTLTLTPLLYLQPPLVLHLLGLGVNEVHLLLVPTQNSDWQGFDSTDEILEEKIVVEITLEIHQICTELLDSALRDVEHLYFFVIQELQLEGQFVPADRPKISGKDILDTQFSYPHMRADPSFKEAKLVKDYLYASFRFGQQDHKGVIVDPLAPSHVHFFWMNRKTLKQIFLHCLSLQLIPVEITKAPTSTLSLFFLYAGRFVPNDFNAEQIGFVEGVQSSRSIFGHRLERDSQLGASLEIEHQQAALLLERNHYFFSSQQGKPSQHSTLLGLQLDTLQLIS
jgi:hypothetical protein